MGGMCLGYLYGGQRLFNIPPATRGHGVGPGFQFLIFSGHDDLATTNMSSRNSDAS